MEEPVQDGSVLSRKKERGRGEVGISHSRATTVTNFKQQHKLDKFVRALVKDVHSHHSQWKAQLITSLCGQFC